MDNIEILSEIVLYQKGSFKRVRRYLRNKHPSLGVITKGFTGWETVQEIDVIIPMGKFEIIDLTPSIVTFSEIEVKPELDLTAG
jgi:ABC-type polysaccharide/polyol phosphate transport system ATPase subunit